MSASNILPIELEIIVGPAKGEKRRFTQDLILLGRNPDNDFSLGADQKISRTHLEFHVGVDKVIVRNISERNFMLVSGREVTEAVLKPGEIIFIGESQIQVNFELQEKKKPPIKKEITPANKGVNLQVNSTASNKAATSPLMSSPLEIGKNRETRSTYNFSDMKQADLPPIAQSMKVKKSGLNPVFITAVVLILAIGVFLFTGNEKKKEAKIALRTNVTAVQNIQQSSESLEAFKKEEAPKRTMSYDQAQQQYLRGFRDYRNGNYSRAMEHFAAALAFYSDHEQAKRYYQLARRKNEEFSTYHFNLGKRYYGIQNYRLCSAHFGIAIRSKRDERDPLRLEALQYLKECDARQVGRY